MQIMRIMLIAPPGFSSKFPARDINPMPPMGLGYLASIIEEMGIDVKILDCLIRGWDHEEEVNDKLIRIGLPNKEIERYIREFNPDIIGINCQFSRQYKIYHQLLSLFKQTKPDCITVAGGAHVTVCPTEVLSDPNCDFILIGEGENSFKELVLALMNRGKASLIDGVGLKQNGQIQINQKQNWIRDLDSIPFPAYHLMELDRYFAVRTSHGPRTKARYCPIITSRGCPARCTFCTAKEVWGERYRMRSVDNVLKEMRLLKDQYGIKEIMFEDDNVTANPKRARELFSRLVDEGFNFIWDTPNGVGVWSIDEEMIDLMQKSGGIKLNFPVESGSQFVLDNIIKKPIKLPKVKKLIDHCKKIDMDVNMFLVIGMPGEKIKDMWQSFRFAADCGCYFPHISVATPYPGSQLFEDCKKYGYFAREFVLDDLYITSYLIKTSDWDENDLRRMLFKGKLYLLWRMLISNPRQFLSWLSDKKLISIIKRIRNMLFR